MLIFALAFCWWLSGAFQIFPLGWLAIAPLWITVYDLPARQRARLGYRAGFVSFWLINWWLVPTITNGAAAIGAAPALGFVLSIVAVTFIAAVHGLQPMICAILARDKQWWTPWLLGGAWTLLDYLRDQGPLRHSWGALGFTQTTDALLLRGSPVIGQHGLTFLCALVSACAAYWWLTRKRVFLAMPVGVLILWHAVGLIPRAPVSGGKSVRVLIVQTYVSSLGKNSGAGPFEQALELTQRATQNKQFDLILWPETTMTLRKAGANFYGGSDLNLWQQFGPKIPLLTGARATSNFGKERNEAVLLMPDGSAESYAKTRLVPFGERPPFVEWLPFLAQFAPDPLIERGDGPQTLSLPLNAGNTSHVPGDTSHVPGDTSHVPGDTSHVPGDTSHVPGDTSHVPGDTSHVPGDTSHVPGDSVGINPAICFESCFPLWRDGKDFGFNAILTNDEWFGWTEAPRQHRAMAQLRAVETGKPVIQSCNGRYSFYIGANGKILATTRGDAAQTLEVVIPDVG